MIDISNIDVYSLESVPLSDTSKLPSFSGVYFAIDENKVVQYVGQTFNIKMRWNGHHRKEQLKKMGNIKIAFLRIDDFSLLPSIESQFIMKLKPILNRGASCDSGSVATPDRKKAPPNKPKVMRVFKTTLIEAPGLGQRIKEAKDRSGKNVKQVCQELGISRQTWYNIESEFLKEGIDYGMLQRIEECLGTSFGVKF